MNMIAQDIVVSNGPDWAGLGQFGQDMVVVAVAGHVVPWICIRGGEGTGVAGHCDVGNRPFPMVLFSS